MHHECQMVPVSITPSHAIACPLKACALSNANVCVRVSDRNGSVAHHRTACRSAGVHFHARVELITHDMNGNQGDMGTGNFLGMQWIQR